MTIKKTGNFRASKRKMPTLSVPSRQGFLQLDDISVSPVEEMQEWTPTFSGSGGLVFTPSDALEARYCRVGHLLYVNMYARGPISGSSSQTIRVTLPFQVGAGGFTNLAGANNSPITYLIRNNSTGGFAPGLASLGTLPSNQVLLTNEGSTLWTVGSARIIAFQGFLELAYEEDYYKPTVKVDKLLESSFFDLPNQTRNIYNSEIPAVTGLANATNTLLGQAMYLPSGKYRFEVFGYLTVKFSVLPSRTYGLMFLSDKASGGGVGDIKGPGSEGLIQVRADILQDSFYHTYETDWSGGIIYVYGNIENVGGTVTTRDISEINITATRLD
jgi:hypothetical protein